MKAALASGWRRLGSVAAVIGRYGKRVCFWSVIGIFVAVIAGTFSLPLWYQAHGERVILITNDLPGSPFHEGDAIIVNEVVDPSLLRIGQVVTFTYHDENTGAAELLTHRIIGFVSLPETTADGKPKIDPSTGGGRIIRYIRTRGDGSVRADAQLTETTKIRGVVLQVKPHWGSWLTWARTPVAWIVLFGTPLLMLAIAEARSWRRKRPKVVRRPDLPAFAESDLVA